MGGQSTEPMLFLSDKNVPGTTNGGGEKGSDAKQGGTQFAKHRSNRFNDPLSERVDQDTYL